MVNFIALHAAVVAGLVASAIVFHLSIYIYYDPSFCLSASWFCFLSWMFAETYIAGRQHHSKVIRSPYCHGPAE
jgi:hypothetical protein